MQLNFNFHWFLAFTGSFILFAMVGTVSHELGHYTAAKLLGYESSISYNWTSSNHPRLNDELDEIYQENKNAIQWGFPFESAEKYQALRQQLRQNWKWIVLGSIGQTLLTGILGLLILAFRGKKYDFDFLNFLAVFLSLFWLRQVFNLLSGIIYALAIGRNSYFGGDEANLAQLLGWPRGSISIGLGLMGAIIGVYVVFIALPKKYRFTFIISGLLGGFTGFYLWMHVLGPYLLPD